MTTFKQKIIQDLTDSGFFPEQASEVFDRLVEHPAQIYMQGRWNDDYTSYPPMMLNILAVAVDSIALDYIKEKMPNAWFRPMFDKELVKELGIAV